jgi:mannose-6-phosphate isomerase
MGSHPSAPSKVHYHDTSTTLKDLIQQYPQKLLSNEVCKTFGSQNLPFLFKVLAVRKALSIQAHPDKILAERLHSVSPDKYPDSNHKPEMVIAFDRECHVLVGFRPADEIAFFLDVIPEFQELLGTDKIREFQSAVLDCWPIAQGHFNEALRKLFSHFMNLPTTHVSQVLRNHIERIGDSLKEEKHPLLVDVYQCVLRLYKDYPDDPGVWSAYWLNLVHMKPFEAVYLAANEPHAYLEGTFVECMSTSDNVVRAGLTPKFKDVQTFCEMLTYECRSWADQVWAPVQFDYAILMKTSLRLQYYRPKCMEFRVLYISAWNCHEASTFSVPSTDVNFRGPCILLVVEGHPAHRLIGRHSPDLPLTLGKVYFIAAEMFHHLEIFLEADKPLAFFVASCGNLSSSHKPT